MVPPDLDGAQLTENAAKIVIGDIQKLRPAFLARAMEADLVQKQIATAKGIGGGVPKLALFRIEQMMFPLPPTDEQDRILECLAPIDRTYHEQEQVLDRLNGLKSALMTDLLTGRKRVSSDLLMAAE
ncbi:restriction endonuclease subunit S [Microvirga sp. VF16]|uniref:restriction endonuclease subunit S n=1 Tax=Microvirga sp. VF16 TaxID=2807101 RepID=UPI00353011A4